MNVIEREALGFTYSSIVVSDDLRACWRPGNLEFPALRIGRLCARAVAGDALVLDAGGGERERTLTSIMPEVNCGLSPSRIGIVLDAGGGERERLAWLLIIEPEPRSRRLVDAEDGRVGELSLVDCGPRPVVLETPRADGLTDEPVGLDRVGDLLRLAARCIA